jgi:SNF2 family DNA or RNA helicase
MHGGLTSRLILQDMGLGKTVQTIANILKRPRNKAEEKLGYTNTTLIVTPL